MDFATMTLGAGVALAVGITALFAFAATMLKHFTQKPDKPDTALVVLQAEVEELKRKIEKLYDLILNQWGHK